MARVLLTDSAPAQRGLRGVLHPRSKLRASPASPAAAPWFLEPEAIRTAALRSLRATGTGWEVDWQ
jgi:hypothetical protein